jgi:lipoprotein-releasing system permease protein
MSRSAPGLPSAGRQGRRPDQPDQPGRAAHPVRHGAADRSYTVAAIFEVGVYDYDKAFVIMPIEDAQTLLMLGDAVGMVEVQTTDADRVEEILAPLAGAVSGKAVIADWRTLNSSLFEALQVERVAMFVVLSIIILVAVFNILSSLIMLVRAKTRDIAILRTMGRPGGRCSRSSSPSASPSARSASSPG